MLNHAPQIHKQPNQYDDNGADQDIGERPIKGRQAHISQFFNAVWALTRMFLGSMSSAASTMPTHSDATKKLTIERPLIFGNDRPLLF